MTCFGPPKAHWNRWVEAVIEPGEVGGMGFRGDDMCHDRVDSKNGDECLAMEWIVSYMAGSALKEVLSRRGIGMGVDLIKQLWALLISSRPRKHQSIRVHGLMCELDPLLYLSTVIDILSQTIWS